MQKIEAVIRPEAVSRTRDALVGAGVGGMTILQAQGMGQQHGFTEYYRGTEVLVQTQPKAIIIVVCEDERVDALCHTILDAAKTGSKGQVGDGKIFVTPVSHVWRIRTGDKDDAAL